MINLQTGKPIDIYLPNVYRYMNKEYIDLFFEKGILRISSFRKFREYPDEIRGDKNEGGGSIAGVSDKSSFRFHVISQKGDDAYMLCGSIVDSGNIKKTFNTNACFRISKPLEFSVAISNAILGFKRSFQGFCNYRDQRVIDKTINNLEISDFTSPEGELIIGGQKGNERINEILGNGMDLMFLKEKKYQEQFEYRFVWEINSKFYEMHDYIDIHCKEAIQFCERIETT